MTLALRGGTGCQLPITLTLNLMSIIMIYLVSIPVGVVAAARRNGAFDHLSSLGLFLLYSMPSFWVATMLIVLLGDESGFSARYLGFRLPSVGLHDDHAEQFTYLEFVKDYWLHLLLPLIASNGANQPHEPRFPSRTSARPSTY